MTIYTAQPTEQNTASELYSENVLGPVKFTMSNLRVAGKAGLPVPPKFVSPGQSPYIIASDEEFSISVDIEFNQTPLSALLMCIGTKINVDFALEGMGKNAAELDLSSSIVTEKDKYNYTLTFTGVPSKVGMTHGLYNIGAVAEIGPGGNPCAQYVFGYGYIQEVILQVY